MAEAHSVPELLQRGDEAAVAIGAPGRTPLRFGELREQVEQTVATLNGFGLGRNDRIAIVLPNGPEMASAFLAIAAVATCAPLNPAYRAEEFDFSLSDLRAKAVIVQAGVASPVIEVARSHHLLVIELTPLEGQEAGRFKLTTDRQDAAVTRGYAGADDIALVLHTSGTTARPKAVPLRHRNLCASARHIRETLALTAADRCLNIMPLFHIHGLIAAVLASIGAGGSVHCPSGFNALRFFGWLAETQPTWYTAVPTMHQAILTRASRHADIIATQPLRLIRSSSSSLPRPVMAELERVFGAPVIESYGMTEAAHQMTSNPLPPRPRKAGSVGVAAGPEVAIMDAAGALLPTGARGEVVIRGANVTSGYEHNPEANASAFTDGWFRTGDEGVFDAEGYLTITGRLKEIINRGGEKISPLEVDEALLMHPAVAQAVSFGVPHEKLGEEVAAAIVLREGATASGSEIRRFMAERLVDFKVPRRIVILDAIPTGATGKVQRGKLAAQLDLA